jgi:hypothetical protein
MLHSASKFESFYLVVPEPNIKFQCALHLLFSIDISRFKFFIIKEFCSGFSQSLQTDAELKEYTIQRTRRRNNNKMAKNMGGKPKGRPDKTIFSKHFRQDQD